MTNRKKIAGFDRHSLSGKEDSKESVDIFIERYAAILWEQLLHIQEQKRKNKEKPKPDETLE